MNGDLGDDAPIEEPTIPVGTPLFQISRDDLETLEQRRAQLVHLLSVFEWGRGLDQDRKELTLIDALLAERKASEAQLHALLYAEEAMCGATFSLKGRNCGDLNDSIKKIRKLMNQE